LTESDPGTAASTTHAERCRLTELEREVVSLRKTNEVLLDRVEHRINVEGGAFAAFQVASNLEKTVADRTAELRVLNERLEHELVLRRSFETALMRAKTEAEESTASRTRFVAAASHDLRQPLNAAILYLEAIDRTRVGAADAESLNGIGLALGALDSLLSALLDISRLDSGGLHPQPTHFPLASLFDRLAREYAPAAEAKELKLFVAPSNAIVHGDIMLLETVLRNLLSNAIKYTEKGQVSMHARQSGDGISILVVDTGTGIEAEHRERIFDEFWRAPGAGGGDKGSMGLGLAIVQRICHLLDTEITVDSEPGSGSTFSLSVTPGDAMQLSEPAATAELPAGCGFQDCVVAVVDDNPQVLRSMVRLLESWDCRVIAGTAVEEVLTRLIDEDLAPGLILADYHLNEDTDGIVAISAINAELEHPSPAIMISSDNTRSLHQRLDELGIPLLTKPVDPARLRAMMQHLLATPTAS
jgi:signal transduction histidine kinase